MSTVRLLPFADLADRDRRVFAVKGIEIGLFRLGDAVFAYENRCPHQGGPVCQGKLMPKVEQPLDAEGRSLGLRFSEDVVHLVCPWHGYEFVLTSGEHPGAPQLRLRRFRTEIRDGEVFVHV